MKKINLMCIVLLCCVLAFAMTAYADAQPVAKGEFQTHTYMVYDYSLSWKQAKEFCQNNGGYLATINSEEEQKFIEDLLSAGKKNHYWLGGSDAGSEGRWYWITDEDWKYTNWDSRQPDNGFGNEHYLQIYKKPNPRVGASKPYKWNDITEDNIFNSAEKDYFNHETIGFICEVEPSSSAGIGGMTSFGSEVSSWAKTELESAYTEGLVPQKLVGEELTEMVTREEFAAIAVALYENLTGEMANTAYANPFEDIYQSAYKDEIITAYDLGITTGTSDIKFSPKVNITREQMATMLTRTYKKAYYPQWSVSEDANYPLDYSGVISFSDDEFISPYARESVYFMAKHGIIQGVSADRFAPKSHVSQGEAYGFATREQAIIIAQRIVQTLKK